MEDEGIHKVIYEAIEKQRKTGNSLSRFGCVNKEGGILNKQDTVCFATMRYGTYSEAHMIWACWNGEAFGVNQEAVNWGRDKPETRRGDFCPGPRSDKWLSFLLDPEISPWKLILPHLVTTDPVIIRESGFILKDLNTLDFSLMFNFLIATRYAYEFNHRVEFWEDLIEDHMVDPRAAYLISIQYTKGGDNAKKPPLRKVLKTPEGYRKNAGGFRYIRDEWGDKQWFAAEYEEVDDHPDWKPGVWDGALQATMGDGHCPLSTMTGYERRILNSNTAAFKKNCNVRSAKFSYGAFAWDIFKTYEDITKPANQMNNLMEVLEYFQTFK